MKTLVTFTCAALLVSACGSIGKTFNTFDREAGAAVDAGDFGNATMNNSLIQSGHTSYTISLNNRFTEAVTPMVNFPFNSTVLDAEAQNILRRQADFIKQFPEVRFKVFGHTDLVGGAGFNRRLGLARANTVVSFLTAQGISRSRLEAVVSRGESQPLVVTEGRERRNRRTVTEVSGFVHSHPTVLNGKYAEVIFREYVASARPSTAVTEATGGAAAGE